MYRISKNKLGAAMLRVGINSAKPQPISTIPAIPVDSPKYHVTAQKRPLDVYAKVGGSRC